MYDDNVRFQLERYLHITPTVDCTFSQIGLNLDAEIRLIQFVSKLVKIKMQKCKLFCSGDVVCLHQIPCSILISFCRRICLDFLCTGGFVSLQWVLPTSAPSPYVCDRGQGGRPGIAKFHIFQALPKRLKIIRFAFR